MQTLIKDITHCTDVNGFYCKLIQILNDSAPLCKFTFVIIEFGKRQNYILRKYVSFFCFCNN